MPSIIDNPAYQGEGTPKQLSNPNYVEDVHAFEDIGAIGFELWTVNDGSIFDNILVCDSWDHAKEVGEGIKKLLDKEKDAKKDYEKANGKDASASAPPGKDEDDDDDDIDDGDKVDLDSEKSDL